jgi:hypothetical protein
MAERRKAHKRESQTAESQTAGENATSRMWVDWQQSAKNAELFFYFRLRIGSEPHTREAFGRNQRRSLSFLLFQPEVVDNSRASAATQEKRFSASGTRRALPDARVHRPLRLSFS